MSDETRKALIAAMEGHWTGSYIEAGPIVDALTAHVRDEMGGARPAEARDMDGPDVIVRFQGGIPCSSWLAKPLVGNEPARGFREAAYLPAARVESLSKERDTLRALLTAEAARVERAERERDEWKACPDHRGHYYHRGAADMRERAAKAFEADAGRTGDLGEAVATIIRALPLTPPEKP